MVGEGPDGAPEGALPLGPEGTLGGEAWVGEGGGGLAEKGAGRGGLLSLGDGWIRPKRSGCTPVVSAGVVGAAI